MIAKVKQAMADATCVSWNADVEKQEQTFSNQVDSILRHLTVHDGPGPQKIYIDDKIWPEEATQGSSMSTTKWGALNGLLRLAGSTWSPLRDWGLQLWQDSTMLWHQDLLGL